MSLEINTSSSDSSENLDGLINLPSLPETKHQEFVNADSLPLRSLVLDVFGMNPSVDASSDTSPPPLDESKSKKLAQALSNAVRYQFKEASTGYQDFKRFAGTIVRDQVTQEIFQSEFVLGDTTVHVSVG